METTYDLLFEVHAPHRTRAFTSTIQVRPNAS